MVRCIYTYIYSFYSLFGNNFSSSSWFFSVGQAAATRMFGVIERKPAIDPLVGNELPKVIGDIEFKVRVHSVCVSWWFA